MTFDEFKKALSLLRSPDKEINDLGKELFKIYNVTVCDGCVILDTKVGYIINDIGYAWSYYTKEFCFSNGLSEKQAYDHIFRI